MNILTTPHMERCIGGYSFDQKLDDDNAASVVSFLVSDGRERVALTSMVSRLCARGVCKPDIPGECLTTLGYTAVADNMAAIAGNIQQKCWRARRATGFQPEQVAFPKRFHGVTTWKGQTDRGYMETLTRQYAQHLVAMAGRTAKTDPEGAA